MQSKEKLQINKNLIFLAVILIVGFILRVLFIDKYGGMWLDEGQTYSIASKTFPNGILSNLYENDFHPPLYFFILHFWMKIFGTEDASLRLLSVLAGMFSIFFSYLTGKELKNSYTGLIAALFISINSLSIYYSQEIRFYVLSGLFSLISTLLLLKILNNKNVEMKNYILLSLINLLLAYTTTLGIVFIFVQVFSVIIYFCFKKRKDEVKKLITTQLMAFVFYLPGFWLLIHQIKMSANAFLNPTWWVYFDSSTIFLIIQNWFAPAISGINYNTPHYFGFLLNQNNSIIYLFTLIPLLIGGIGVIRGCCEKNKNIILPIITTIFFLIEIFGVLIGKIGLLTRYTFIIVPLIITYSAYGLNCLKNKIISKALIITYVVINVVYLIFCNCSAPKMERYYPIKIAAEILQSYQLSSKDMVIMPYEGQYLKKYYPQDAAQISKFDLFPILTSEKPGEFKKIYGDEIFNNKNNPNLKKIVTTAYNKKIITSNFEEYFKQNIFDKIKTGSYLIYVEKKDPVYFGEKIFDQITQSNFAIAICQKGAGIPLVEYAIMELRESIDKNFGLVKVNDSFWYKIYIYQKNKNTFTSDLNYSRG